jgi:hypothetical protein
VSGHWEGGAEGEGMLMGRELMGRELMRRELMRRER